MTNLSDDQIEDAFAQIRADFEKRGNEEGFPYLNSFEEQWAATGRLSELQLAWLQCQLSGAWKQKARPAAKTGDGRCKTPEGRTDITPYPPVDQSLEQLLDAMIQRKLEDLLKRAVKSMS